MITRYLIGAVCAFTAVAAFAERGIVFIVSDSTDHPAQPNFCAWYFDGAIEAVKEPVALDDEGLPYCIYEISNISVGTHTVQAAFVVDTPWEYQEGLQSAPFTFTRPADSVGLPAPVLKLGVF